MWFRIGINVGDVMLKDGDIFGDGVNIAARLEALAEPGGICLSAAAHEQVRDRLDIAFVDLGDDGIEMIVAVRHPPPDAKDQTIAVVSPCGACRELIFDYDPKARVIVPNGRAAAVVPIAELLPNKYSRGPER